MHAKSKKFDDLEPLLKCTVVDIVAVSKTRIIKKTLTSSINLQNYSSEFNPTESSAGVTLLCIANYKSYKPHFGLILNKVNQLKSNFMERIHSRKRNIIGCLFRHPNMGVSDFNKNFLNILLDKLSKENNQDFHLGQFNFNILNYNDH